MATRKPYIIADKRTFLCVTCRTRIKTRRMIFSHECPPLATHCEVGHLLESDGRCAPCETFASIGRRVIVNGFEGTITEVCTAQLAGMIVVRLPGGSVCVDVAEVQL